MKERAGLRNILRGAKQNLPRWVERLPQLPDMAFDVLEQIKEGRLQVATQDQELRLIRREIREIHRRLVCAVAGVGRLLAAGLVGGFEDGVSFQPERVPTAAWFLGGLGLLSFLLALWSRREP
jgi:ubiquinone biosynthesis protein